MSSSEQAAHPDNDPHKNDPLPAGWTRQYSKSNAKYFYHHKSTNVTQWHFPTASEAKDPNVAKKRAEEAKEREKKRAMSSVSTTSSTNGHTNTNDDSKIEAYNIKRPRTESSKNDDNSTLDLADKTCVAIIVPYRDIHEAQQRAAHLKKFVPHMISFLNRCKRELQYISDYHIYIIEQSNDQRKFNRGKLLNIGFDIARTKFAKRNHDVFIFHDVDLLPDQDLAVWYTKFPTFPIHIARVWDRYSGNPKYFGGVVSFSSSDYKRINGVSIGATCESVFLLSIIYGKHQLTSWHLTSIVHLVLIKFFYLLQYPNNYFGWGGEDDEMQRRLERLGIKFVAPDRGTLLDLEQMSINEKMNFLKQHQEWKCMVKWELKDEHESTWQTNGLLDLKYAVLSETALDDSNKATKITVDVKLNGNHWTNEKAGIDYVDTSWKK